MKIIISIILVYIILSLQYIFTSDNIGGRLSNVNMIPPSSAYLNMLTPFLIATLFLG